MSSSIIYWPSELIDKIIPRQIQLKLDELRNALIEEGAVITDPIKYIQTQYDWDKSLWIEEKTTETLWKLLTHKWFRYSSPANMHRALKWIGIKFRPWASEKWKEKIKSKAQSILDENHKKLIKALKTLSLDWNWEITQELIDTQTSNKDLALLILWIQSSDLSDISDNSWLKAQALAKSINLELARLIPWLRENWIDIDHFEISKWGIANALRQS